MEETELSVAERKIERERDERGKRNTILPVVSLPFNSVYRNHG